MEKSFGFRIMITPWIVKTLFWIVVLASLVVGIYDIAKAKYFLAIQILIFGPLLARIISEIIILFFTIAQRLETLCHLLQHVTITDSKKRG